MANKEDDVSGLSSRLTEAAEMQVGQGALSGQDMKGGGPPVGSNADDLTENEDDSHNVEGDGPERNGFDAPELNRSRRQGGRGGIISLKMLIDDEIIVPGEDVLTVDYKEYSYTASLLPDGRIYFVVEQERMYFESPSAFSVFVKRITNPTRKADDGWKSVKYEGRLLEQYKAEYARKRLGDDSLLDDTFEPYTKRLRKDRLQSLHTPREVNRRLFTETVPRIQRHASPRFASLGADDESNCQSIDPFDPEKQPFKLKVSPVAEIVMDFHSHLSMTGTIGLLGGTWDVVTKTLE